MNHIKILGRWFLALSKRLYKKPIFLILLALIPVLVLSYSRIDRADSGMMTIALAQEGQDATAAEIMQGLKGSSQLVRFQKCQTPADARQLVEMGKADAAWIFPSDTKDRLLEFAMEPTEENAFLTVLARKDSVMLRMSQEILSKEVFVRCAKPIYLDFIRRRVPGLDHVSQEQLLEYYDNTKADGELFAFDEASAAMAAAQEVHYLTAPVRGLLALVILLGGLSTALMFTADLKKGTFSWVSRDKMWLVEWGCQWVTLLNLSAAVWLALALGGLSADPLAELFTMVLAGAATSGFCMLLRRLLRGWLPVAIPVILVVSLVICPVFFDLTELTLLSRLLPPTYYIQGVYSGLWLLLAAAYACAGVGLCLLWDRVRGLFRLRRSG